MVIDKINVRQHSHMRSAELTTPAASPVAATPVVVMAAVGVAAKQ